MALEGPLPTVTVSPLEPPEVYVTVTSSDGGSATFHATVTVDKPPIGTVMVQIDGSTSTGWPTVVSPQSVPFLSSGDIEITITVSIPKATPCSSVGRVTISVIATYPGGSSSAQSSGTINVRQYFSAMLNITPTLGVDNPQHYKILVTNKGNGHDSFELTTPFSPLDNKNGIITDIQKPRTGTLPLDGNESLEVVVKYGPTAPVGKYKFIVRVSSLGSIDSGNNSFSDDYPLYLEVSPVA